MQLSQHFTLSEFTKSQTARRRGIRNRPGAAQIDRLKTLCMKVLEPTRMHFGKPVFISSGYRSPRLNRAIGGAPRSQHKLGEAADFEIRGIDNRGVAIWIRDNLAFDQLILEGARRGDPNAGWIHVSYREGRLRRSVMTATFVGGRARYTQGIS